MKKTYLHFSTYSLLLIMTFLTSCNGQSSSKILDHPELALNLNSEESTITISDRAELEISTKSDVQIAKELDKLMNAYEGYEKFNMSIANSAISKLCIQVDFGKFNGSILVAKEGKIIYKKGLGFANMESDIPNQSDTKHRVVSVGKQFTALLALQLVANNQLDLQAPISTYLPNYPKDKADQITVHHLLTHTSGIPNYDVTNNDKNIVRKQYNAEQIISSFADLPLNFEPGKRYKYSNADYVLLSMILETITQKTYTALLQEKILTPLKMKNTGYDQQNKSLENKASGYYRDFGAIHATNNIDMSLIHSDGGLYTTVEDLYLWDKALYTEKLLPKKYLDLLFKSYVPAGSTYYSYGSSIGEMPIGNTNQQVKTVLHNTRIDGFRSLITRIPSSKSTIIILSNAESSSLHKMTYTITDILYNQPYELPNQSVAYALLKTVKEDGIAKGITHFNKIKAAKGYYLDENEMILIGHHLLQSEQIKDASTLFKLGIEAFPNSYHLYDSLGEAYLKMNDKAKAIENYKKSLKLNPNSEHTAKMLKQLGSK